MKVNLNPRRGFSIAALHLLFFAHAGWGQAAQPASQDSAGQPVSITLEEAIHRAQVNDPNFAASKGDSKIAALDKWNAAAALLPSIVYHNQYLYTQSNGVNISTTPGTTVEGPIFIANNAEREYMSQGVVNETFGVDGVANLMKAEATQAQAAADLEVAKRGLVSAVTQLYYGLAAADNKLIAAQQAYDQAADFSKLTSQREKARESAHTDSLKAMLGEQQRMRELSDAKLEAEKARLELAVLLFPDPHTPYTIDTSKVPDIPARADVEQAASKNNAELKSAMAALKANNADVLGAWGAYLPDIGLNFTYGVDAPQLATKGPLVPADPPYHQSNLGYAASVTVDVPIWDWLSTQRKVKQSEIRRDVAKVTLSSTQKHMIAKLDEAYSEATAARDQFATLNQGADMAAESLRLVTLAYKNGEATVLDVTDAQNTYVTAVNAREDGRVRYQMALADLQTLTGTM